MKKIFLFFLIFVAVFAEDKIYYEDDISPKEAYEMQKNGAILIDVRTPGEFIYAGHAIGAINIPIFYYSFKTKDIKSRINFSKLELKKSKALDSHKMYEIIPIENRNFLEDVKQVIKKFPNRALLIICRSGARSQYAANILAKNGINEVYNVEDGFIFGWKKSNLPYGGE
ncbi:rhodanese-like domain-containing protein [Nitrosophilus kaiyonis]|uniref:rhodanese-like domain-containing protein n=1 Tax=Nitrosophilus kaiyonis TaxID=2930200 RepID=UPI0024921B90|nr:rhodanese-like domain-containing protein [Nitrosophilus kaiyonis]